MCVEDLDDLGEVGERAGQPVDLVDDHDVDLARLAMSASSRCRAGRSIVAAGEPAVVIQSRDKAAQPSCCWLRDEGLAGLALGIERIEVLLEPLLGGSCGCRSHNEVLPGND